MVAIIKYYVDFLCKSLKINVYSDIIQTKISKHLQIYAYLYKRRRFAK